MTVTFDGVAAPIFFPSAGQVNVQVPFEMANRSSTRVVSNFLGRANSPVTVPVAVEQPAFFTATPLGRDSIATNQDNSVNSAQNPAVRGSYVTIYGTGIGQPGYTVATGRGAPVPPPGYTGNYTCTLQKQVTNAAFAGWTPVSIGLAQFNLQIPANTAVGPVPVVCTSPAGIAAQQGTLYVK